jgi:transcriptional regulator NrdR family protein
MESRPFAIFGVRSMRRVRKCESCKQRFGTFELSDVMLTKLSQTLMQQTKSRLHAALDQMTVDPLDIKRRSL